MCCTVKPGYIHHGANLGKFLDLRLYRLKNWKSNQWAWGCFQDLPHDVYSGALIRWESGKSSDIGRSASDFPDNLPISSDSVCFENFILSSTIFADIGDDKMKIFETYRMGVSVAQWFKTTDADRPKSSYIGRFSWFSSDQLTTV